MEKRKYDIIIIGAGHAGVEAAWISSSLGLNVALITLPNVKIADTPCNPAIGGVGKGQLVREIDALGGIIGKITDLSAIHYKVLNESKGYAVQSTRMQVDKNKYSDIAEKLIRENENITLIREKINQIKKQNGKFLIEDNNGQQYISLAVIICTGTFLDGRLHIGKEQFEGGVFGEDRSKPLIELIPMISEVRRFKTGTPARISKDSINWDILEEQKTESMANNFHYAHKPNERFNNQIKCYLTRTNRETMKIIRENKMLAPLYNGQIQSIGPRYCPSIEDKAFRYPDRDEHHIFLEKEGNSTESVYPNGISTSLPREIQEKFIKTIKGLENAKIVKYGYAVEYDVIDPTKLNYQLEYKDIEGLYFAGQVNGTSGYEEAAAQGIVAGINAALKIMGMEKVVFSRKDSYIGVMIEDIITNERDEPYRLFTARAENRLYIREDNATSRMSKYRKKLNKLSNIDIFQQKYLKQGEILSEVLNRYYYKSNDGERFKNNMYGEINEKMSMSDLLTRAEIDPYQTLKSELKNYKLQVDDRIIKEIAISKKYNGYIAKAKEESDNIEKYDHKRINWEELSKNSRISNECRQRIMKIRPETFSQLRKINGIRPATLAYTVTII